MTVPGSVYTKSGTVGVAPNLGFRNVRFGDIVSEATGLPTRLFNDLNAITYGEAHFGGGRGERNVACVFIGTGIGMGVVCNGVLYEGEEGLAPEIGHIKYESGHHGRDCGCGQKGCIEAYVSGAHLPALLKDIHDSGLPSPLMRRKDWRQLTSLDIERAAVAGDECAQQLWREVSERCAWLLGIVTMTFNPKVVVIGGGVLQTAPSLREATAAHMPHYSWPSFLANMRVVDTELDDSAGIIGAGIAAHHRNQAPPAA
jgi:glucokinase